MAAELNEGRKGKKKQPRFTPSASETDEPLDMPTTVEPLEQSHPADAPPTYAESVDLNSDRQVVSGGPATYDNKIQYDDDDDSEDDISDTETLPVANDDEAWALDEYAAADEPPSYEDATNVPSEEELVREILTRQQQRHQRVEHPLGRLPCPVIIPQRRPRNGSRGFVRAYAPALENVGINQATFLKFLSNFHKSAQASPWFTVIVTSGGAVGNAPSAIAMAVSTAVQFSSGAGSQVEGAHKINNFLDRMNEQLFKPAGVFAFLAKFRSEVEPADAGSAFIRIGAGNVNLSTNQIAPKYDPNASTDGMASLTTQMKMFRLAPEATHGPNELAESAPLVFPQIDDKFAQTGTLDEALKAKVNGPSSFVQDYLDRKARLLYGRDDKVETTEAGPSQSAQATGIVGLLTGGLVNSLSFVAQRHAELSDRRAVRRERRTERMEERHERRLDRHQRRMDRGAQRFENRFGRPPLSVGASSASGRTESCNIPVRERFREQRQDSGSTKGDGLVDGNDDGLEQHGEARHAHAHCRRRRRRGQGLVRGAVRREVNEDVLYLMIVNLPSEQGLAEARAILRGS